MTNLTLTEGQDNALTAFVSFMQDPKETAFTLSGYSGTGKSTLVKTLLDRLPNFMKTIRLVNPSVPDYETVLTATTNKAAENFAQITGMDVRTIHSFLGLRVVTDYTKNTTSLVPKSREVKTNILLFIDEYSFVDSQLLGYIFSLTHNCKIVFIGDPAQLTPIKSTGVPVYAAKFMGAELTEVVRQAKTDEHDQHPISALAEKFRNTVNTGEFFSFKPDGKYVIHMDRTAFNTAIEDEFTRPDWRYQDSKILAWTNQCTINFNHSVRDKVMGDPHFQVGDYAVCNSFLSVGKKSFKTDQMVCITAISPDLEEFGVMGKRYELDNAATVFGPNSLADKNKRIRTLRSEGKLGDAAHIDTCWVDLRAAYACTVNKAQGSTFDRVFIDLDDISRCNSGDQIARMLYVGTSRPRHQLFLTGDLA